jgi:Kef-type K+ transport system membrane component KefB
VAFDVAALGRDVQTLLLVPTFLALFLLARGLPAWLYRRDLPRRELAPLALSLSVASLGIVVVVTSVGLKSGQLDADVARALIGAALLSLLVYPTAARVLLARAQTGTVAAGASSARA